MQSAHAMRSICNTSVAQGRHKELAASLVREQHALVHAHPLALVARGGHHHRGQVALACSRQAKSESRHRHYSRGARPLTPAQGLVAHQSWAEPRR